MLHLKFYICIMLTPTNHKRLDQLGITVSILCAVHCALLPVVMMLLPLIGLGFFANPEIEAGIILLSLMVGLISMSKSWRVHRSFKPAGIILLGFLFIMTGHCLVMEKFEWILLTAGSSLVALAHYINWRYTRSACHDQH